MDEDDIPYVGEIRLFGGAEPPNGWNLCYGQRLPISQFVELFALLGTTYGGDGINFFNLPDLRGRLAIHTDENLYPLGQQGGAEQVALAADNLPAHTHQLIACTSGGSDNPSSNLWGVATQNVYAQGPGTITMSGLNTTAAGNSQPHDNMVPFLCVNYIIALQGIFPSRAE